MRLECGVMEQEPETMRITRGSHKFCGSLGCLFWEKVRFKQPQRLNARPPNKFEALGVQGCADAVQDLTEHVRKIVKGENSGLQDQVVERHHVFQKQRNKCS